MMNDVFVVSDNIISPVGNTAAANFRALVNNESGVKEHVLPDISPVPFYASLLQEDLSQRIFIAPDIYTKFEQLLILSISDALEGTEINIASPDAILIVSSTKGNISLLETTAVNAAAKEQIGLFSSAKKIAAYFSLANTPIIISNACISGLTALLTAKRLLETGQFKHAVVAGADVISMFILSGFQSFQAISAQPCKPFDAARNGINLGEAAATIILSSSVKHKSIQLTPVKITGGAVTNDAIISPVPVAAGRNFASPSVKQ